MLTNTKKHLQHGFSIVELLIVIVVIGILATLSLNSVAQAQNRAKAVAIVSGVRNIEKALMNTASSEGMTTWWDDEPYKDPVDGRSSIEYMMTKTPLGQYLKEVPKVQGFSSNMWEYDNDGNVYNGCEGKSTGVNIQIYTDNNLELEKMVDDIIDNDDNLACGKIRRDTQGEFVYLISQSPTVK